MTVNFRLISEFQTIHRRPFELADPLVLDPTSVTPVPLVEGEFLQLDAAYKMERDATTPAVVPSYAFFAEQGRYETQAIQKGPFLYMGDYEADTLIFDGTGITTVGQLVEVRTITVASLSRRGLMVASSGYVIGHVTRLPANNNGYLRFIRTA
jgi:hypothetical protein